MAPETQQPELDADTTTTSSEHALPHRQRSKSDLEKLKIEQYVARDLLHSVALLESQERLHENYVRTVAATEDYRKVRQEYRQWFPPSKLYGEGYDGYGNGRTDGPPRVVYPATKPRLGQKRTHRLRIQRKDLAQQADHVEELVPIRLEVDHDKIKLRDTFTWNMHDRTVPLELFANQFVEDLGLTHPVVAPVLDQVQNQIKEQLGDYFPHVYIEEDALDPELPYSAYKNEEMRIIIRLNITIGPHTLEDKFEWEINNPLNSPEEFAQSMTRELSLSGEFTTAIAHCIREQSQLFTRSLYIVGHPFDGRPMEDADLVSTFLPSPIPSVFRPQQQSKEFAPILYEVTEADLEKSEMIYSREQRRQKRSVNRRGGPTLPDLKDRQRTVRTLVVSSVIPGEAESVEKSRLYKHVAAKGKRAIRDGDLSETDDSEESGPDSPALSNLQAGTARTRNMRGAATAAQQRMANIGRSETPEFHQETRTSRRFGGAREDSPEIILPTRLVVKLNVGRERLKKLLQDIAAGVRPQGSRQTSSHNARPQSSLGTPVPGAMGPPSTPGTQSQQLPPPTTPAPAGQIGRLDAPPVPPPGGPVSRTYLRQ